MLPLHNYLLLKTEPERVTKGGIVLAAGPPDPKGIALERGTVTDIGPGLVTDRGVLVIPNATMIGDVVLFNRHGAIAVPEQPGRVLVSERDVIAIVEGPSVASNEVAASGSCCDGPLVAFTDGERKVHEYGCRVAAANAHAHAEAARFPK